MNKLLIVESKNKVKTINQYLLELQKDGTLSKDDTYDVDATIGHILELPIRWMPGKDEVEWNPEKKVIKDKGTVVTELKKKAKKADVVLVATDPDREGEAIADDVVKKLEIENKYQRITFNEITKEKIGQAINAPEKLDENLVNAQKARMLLDRVFGYSLSGWIRKKLWNTTGKMSAGRVQSPTLKLVVERELQIENYVPKDFVKISQEFKDGSVAPIELKENIVDENSQWSIPEFAGKIKKDLTGKLTVVDIQTRVTKMRSLTHFKQSAVYKSASSKFGMSAAASRSAMNILFEKGLISYPRTDSTRYSQTFIDKARKYISKKFGENYIASEIKGTASGKQDAHEALRVTDPTLTPEQAMKKIGVSTSNNKMYRLIYNHTLQSLMVPPKRESLRYDLDDAGYKFKLSSSKVIFDGYYVVSGYEADRELSKLEKGEVLESEKIVFLDEKTKPAPRYNEGSLIEKMENVGIGRPSTFSTTVSKLLNFEFMEKDGNALKATDKGKASVFALMLFYNHIINEDYTRGLELVLDDIASGDKNYKEMIVDFWIKLKKEVEAAIIKQDKSEETKKQTFSNETVEIALRASAYGYNTAKEYKEVLKSFMKYVKMDNKDIHIDYDGFVKNEFKNFYGIIMFPLVPKRGPYIEVNKKIIYFDKKTKYENVLICEKCNRNPFVFRGTAKKTKRNPDGTPSWFMACSGFPRCKNTKSIDDQKLIDKLEKTFENAIKSSKLVE